MSVLAAKVYSILKASAPLRTAPQDFYREPVVSLRIDVPARSFIVYRKAQLTYQSRPDIQASVAN
jgi:hypothetical protein